MPVIDCPYPDCGYQTQEGTEALAVVLLQMHANAAHPVPSSTGTTTAASVKADKVSRPKVSIGGSSEDWSYFCTRWQDYKEATKVSGKDLVIQLLECCDEDLRKDLTRSAGGSLTSKSENDVLEAMRKLAVKEENVMVARVTLFEMKQDRDEPIRSFDARVRGQANVCKYTVSCPSCDEEVNYTNQILRDALTRGVADQDIQLDLLSDTNQDMTLEEVFQFIERKEAGKSSANKLLHAQGADGMKSQYKKKKGEKPINKTEQCSYCGNRGHGKFSPLETRKKLCPAYNKKCKNCGKQNHFDKMCKSEKAAKDKDEEADTEGAVFDSLCSLRSNDKKPLFLDHHLYDEMNNCWLKRRSKPQPFVDLSIDSKEEDYNALGYTFPKKLKMIKNKGMADTGCQSCLVSMSIVRRMGLNEKDLIPVSMQMQAANSNSIEILGAVILRLTGKSKSNEIYTTKQMVYVTKDSNKLFLSREACIALHMISDKFPTIGEVNQISKIESPPNKGESISIESAITCPCECPRRELPPKKPTTIPFAPTVENRENLQNWLLDYYKSSTFNTCAHQPLPMMEGPPIHLMIDSNAKPVAVHTPIPVPLHWQEEVKAGLEQDIRLGVIEPVPIGEPVSWCHRMVICAKKNGKPRRTVDLQALNAHATRETHHTQSPFHQARAVPSNKKKSVFDCWNGYHSIPLYEGDKHLTTFITPWGRMRYRVAPQGYIASGDAYSRRFDEIVSDFPNKTKCIDDALLWTDTIKESFFQAVDWLDLLGNNGVISNPEKFVFGADEVEFAGFEVTNDSVRPCSKLFEAIEDYPTPRNISDIRSWYGLINQVSYTFATTEFLLPFRELLKPNTTFVWTDELNNIFEVSKKVIIEEIKEGVRIFDKGRATCLATDWSKDGIGHWLLQKHCKCNSAKPFCCNTGWKTTLVGSRFTHAAESRYAPVEGEALAVADGLDKTRYFVLGCPDLTVAVDHKPLLKIFGDRALNDIPNNRLRNLKEKTLRYRFNMVHVPGVKHKAADATSRHPTGTTNPEMMVLPDDVSSISEEDQVKKFPSSIFAIEATEPFMYEDNIILEACDPIDNLEAITWDMVKVATMSDPALVELINIIENGFPSNRKELPDNIQEYFQFREHLYTIDGVVLYKKRTMIPKCLQNDVLDVLHSGHQCVTSMTARAEDTVFWPGITPAINARRANCHRCNSNAPSQPSAPPTPAIQPVYPFQCICADYFKNEGSNYLVIVDRYSNWPIIEQAKDGSKGLIDALRRTFATYGIPNK